MDIRSINVALISSLAVFLTACAAKTLDVGATSAGVSEIKYTGGCTPAMCANQSADCVGGTQERTCAPDPNAGNGSLPAGSCLLTATCTGSVMVGPEITCTGGCTVSSCGNQAVGCLQGGSPQNMTCAPHPLAGTGSVPAGSCELRATCDPPDSVGFAITYVEGCTACTNQAVTCTTGTPENVTCAPRSDSGPALGGGCEVTGSVPAGCELRCTCSSPDAGG
jgi:hypothetical protein